MDHRKDGASQLLLSYGYYPDSNIQTINNGGTLESYVYDTLDRLAQATAPAPVGWGTLTYTYDGVGNRLTRNGASRTYVHGAYNKLTEIWFSGVRSVTYGYDNNGNAISKTILPSDTWEYNYDSANRLLSIEHPPSTYVQCHGYDTDDRRVRIERPPSGPRLRNLWLGDILLAEEQVGGGVATTDYVYLGGRLVARLDASGTYFYLQDHLGSTRLIANRASGATVFSTRYQPFGVEMLGFGAETVKYIQRQGDPATGGLYYLLSRHYDPEIGRFLSRDSIFGSLALPQTQNRYSYATNNPIGLSDPNGDVIPLLIIVGALIIAGSAAALVSIAIPEARPYLDMFFTAVGFIPVFGDAAAGAYFLTQDAIECAQGRCNAANVALDLFGLVPLAGDVGKLARGTRVADLVPFAGRLGANANNLAPIVGRSGNVFDISEEAFQAAYQAGRYGDMPERLARGRFAHEAIQDALHGFNVGPAIGPSARGGSLFPDAWRQGHVIEIKPWHGGIIERSWQAQIDRYIGAHVTRFGTPPYAEFLFYRYVP